MAVVIPPSQTSTPRMQQGLLNENFQRQQAGLDPLAGLELEQFQGRQQADVTRQAQLEDLDAILADRESRAEEMAETLRATGLGDVAERFRRASRRQNFNLARRGLAGGSAAIQQREQAEAAARQDAEGVAEQARLSALESTLQAIGRRDQLAQEAIRANPFLVGQERLRTQGTREDAAVDQALADLQSQQREADLGRSLGLARILGSTLGATGPVAQVALEGSA